MPPEITPQSPPAKPVKPVARPLIGKNLFSVLAVIAGFILLLLLLLAIGVAKTGVIEVPVLTNYFYHGPEPVRRVTAKYMTPEAFRVLVGGRLISQATQGRKPPYTILVTEEEMTGGLAAVIDVALRDEVWKSEDVQLATMPEYLEFFGKFRRGPWHVDTRIRFVPIVEENGIRFEPTDIRLGDYPIDPEIARVIAGVVFSRDLGTWILKFGEASFQSVELHEGDVEVVANPTS